MAFLRKVGVVATAATALLVWQGAGHSTWAGPAGGAAKRLAEPALRSRGVSDRRGCRAYRPIAWGDERPRRRRIRLQPPARDDASSRTSSAPALAGPSCWSPTGRRARDSPNAWRAPTPWRPICFCRSTTIRCRTRFSSAGNTRARTTISTIASKAIPSSSPTIMPTSSGSFLFGQLMGEQLKARGLQYTAHYIEKFMGHRQRLLVDVRTGVYRYDQLIVLKNTQMPAVLLEAGSIINRDEELLMSSPERQSAISAAVTRRGRKLLRGAKAAPAGSCPCRRRCQAGPFARRVHPVGDFRQTPVSRESLNWRQRAARRRARRRPLQIRTGVPNRTYANQ